MHQKNAASVLPLPVGAISSACSPAAIRAQPCACTGVARSNDDSNHARAAGPKGVRGMAAF